MAEKIKNILHALIPGEEIDDPEITKHQRLTITKLGMDGLDDMFEYSKNSIFFRNLNLKEHKSKKDTERYLLELIRRTKEGYAGGEAMYWFIRIKPSNRVIGTFGFINLNEREKSGQIGKGLSPNYWGKGYVYELLGIILTFAFKTANLDYLYSLTQRTNIANIISMEKGGFVISEYMDNCMDGIGKSNDAVKLILKKEDAKPGLCFKKAFEKYKN